MSLLMLVGLIILLLALRVPVGLAFLGPGVIYMAMGGFNVGYSLRIVADGVNSFPLLAIPLFVFMGIVANKLGVAERLFEFALASLSRVKGNLAYVNIMTSFGFAWMSGSALADAAGLSRVQIPAMVRSGFPFKFAAGLTASTTLISPVMPPSIVAVLFASAAAVSTGALFAASVIPAVLIALSITVYVFFWIRRNPNFETVPFDAQRFWKALRGVLAPAIVPVIILGGILSGTFTPTEAAAIGATVVLFLGLFYRKLNFKVLWDSTIESVTIAGSIMVIIAGAQLLGWILANEQIPQQAGEYIQTVTENPIVFLLLINILLILLGTVVDASAVIIVAAPVLVPIAALYGIDPIHLGVIMIVNLMIGLLTPPVGQVVFVIGSVTKRPVEDIFRGVLPFMIPFAIVLALLTFVPEITMILPQLLGLV